MNRKGMVWAPSNTPMKFSKTEKEGLMKKVEVEIAKTTKVKQAVSRIDIRAGRVYLYYLYEPSKPEGAVFTVPLIDGKYLEFPYARITIFDKYCRRCSLDWQRHNNQWMTLEEGSIEECIQKMELSEWFE
jgi:hypothetical protein